MNFKFYDIIFWGIVLFTIFIIMSGSYLPMVDLPQHAGQVSTLDNIIKNRSQWSDLVELNFTTPYLCGYLSWLFLVQFFDIVTASKVLVSLIFLLFVCSFDYLAKLLNASKLVKWISIPTFFGFCYDWGFATYLLATSIGLLFFCCHIKWVNNKKVSNLFLIFILGIILYFSHMLSYLFFCFLSFLYVLFSINKVSDFLKISMVYLFYLFLLIFYFVQGDSLSGMYGYGMSVDFQGLGEKLIYLLAYPFSMSGDIYVFVGLFFLVFPFLANYKLTKDKRRYIPLIVCSVCWFALPHFLYNTYFIYERYSILFFGFYYLIFDSQNKYAYAIYMKFLFVLIVLYCLILDYKNIIFAKKETQNFEKILLEMKPEKKLLTLIFEPTGYTLTTPFTYVHFGSWYQAQKNGWSDFNFAWFHPQIVRYKPETAPKEIKPGFEWEPAKAIDSCQEYDLILIRVYNPAIKNYMADNNCSDYILQSQQGEWYLYEKATK